MSNDELMNYGQENNRNLESGEQDHPLLEQEMETKEQDNLLAGQEMEAKEQDNLRVEQEVAAKELHKLLTEQEMELKEQHKLLSEQKEEAKKQDGKKEDGGEGGGSAGEQFASLPIESLICKPIIAAAQGQQELTAVYIDGIKKLAYDDNGDTNKLSFAYKRPVVQQDGTMSSQDCTVDAPLLSLVPLPAFTMDELTVDFNMEIKSMDMEDSKTHKDVSSTVKYNSWFGLNASITGNVSSDTEHKRQTDSTATYKIHARAVQQQPSEGMAKLTALFAQSMEPINNKS